jgi:hypothetical protein
MTSIAPIPENSLIMPSATELSERYKLEPGYASLLELPKNFLPELIDIYAFLDHLSLSAERFAQFPCSSKAIDHFLNSAEYRMLCDQLGNEEAASDEDGEKVIKTIISSHSLPQNISPPILAEVFMEIIRELKPSKPALHFTRVSIRNSQTFVPSPKEFRDTLIKAMKSVSTLADKVFGLPELVNQARAAQNPWHGVT